MHTADPEHRVPHLAFQPDQLSDVPFLPMGDVVTSYYLRMRVLDKPGVLADIARILADRDISIEAMIQKESPEGENQADIPCQDITLSQNVFTSSPGIATSGYSRSASNNPEPRYRPSSMLSRARLDRGSATARSSEHNSTTRATSRRSRGGIGTDTQFASRPTIIR